MTEHAASREAVQSDDRQATAHTDRGSEAGPEVRPLRSMEAWKQSPAALLAVQQVAGNRAASAVAQRRSTPPPSPVQREEGAAPPPVSDTWFVLLKGGFEFRGRDYEVDLSARPAAAAAEGGVGVEVGGRSPEIQLQELGSPSKLLESTFSAVSASGRHRAGPLNLTLEADLLRSKLRSAEDHDLDFVTVAVAVDGTVDPTQLAEWFGLRMQGAGFPVDVRGRIRTSLGVNARVLRRYLNNLREIDGTTRRLESADRARARSTAERRRLDRRLRRIQRDINRAGRIQDPGARADRLRELQRRWDARAAQRNAVNVRVQAATAESQRLRQRLRGLGRETADVRRVLDQERPLGRRIRREVATRAALRMGGRLLLKLLPVVNLASLGYDLYTVGRFVYALARGEREFGGRGGGGGDDEGTAGPASGATDDQGGASASGAADGAGGAGTTDEDGVGPDAEGPGDGTTTREDAAGDGARASDGAGTDEQAASDLGAGLPGGEVAPGEGGGERVEGEPGTDEEPQTTGSEDGTRASEGAAVSGGDGTPDEDQGAPPLPRPPRGVMSWVTWDPEGEQIRLTGGVERALEFGSWQNRRSDGVLFTYVSITPTTQHVTDEWVAFDLHVMVRVDEENDLPAVTGGDVTRGQAIEETWRYSYNRRSESWYGREGLRHNLGELVEPGDAGLQLRSGAKGEERPLSLDDPSFAKVRVEGLTDPGRHSRGDREVYTGTMAVTVLDARDEAAVYDRGGRPIPLVKGREAGLPIALSRGGEEAAD